MYSLLPYCNLCTGLWFVFGRYLPPECFDLNRTPLISSKVKFESWQSVKDWPENSFSGNVNVAGAHAKLSLALQVDVWSVGVIFYQMLFGKRPFGHNQCQEQLVREDTIINARRVEFPTRPSVSHEAKVSSLLLLSLLVFSFCRKCLKSFNDAQRLSTKCLAFGQMLIQHIFQYTIYTQSYAVFEGTILRAHLRGAAQA